MELLTKKYVYQIVGESTVGSNECIIKSEALSLASKNRKNVTSDLSTYSSNEYIDKFEVEDMPDLRKFKFNKTAFQFGENGGNGTSGVVSTDIDGNDIAFTALANVDWVKVTKAQDNTVEFTVSNNTGNMRSAKISGTNSTGFTDTINIQQDAYTPQYSHTYTLRINGAASQPTKVVINNQEVTPVKQNDSYVCIYTYSSSNVDDAPSKVSYSIAGGLKSSEVTNVSTNVSPLSWNLDNGLTKTFAVSATETVRSYSWDYQAGVDNFISIDSEDVVEMTSNTSSRSTDLNYTVSTPNGVTVVKSGMTFTATAGSTSNTGTMTVTVNGKTYDIDITYDPAIVEKTYTYTLKASGANGAPTMTINNQSITPTYASGVYTGVYSITCPEGSQPSTVNWSISGGVPSTDWGQYYISASPSSWSVTGAGSKTFSVSISQDKTEYDWSAASGSISYNSSASTRITSSEGTWRPSSGDNLQVSVDAPSWVSTSMSGSTLTASTDGSETSNRSGVITLTTAYSDGTAGSCTISVNYTAPEPEETWPDWSDSSVEYVFAASGGTSYTYDYDCSFIGGQHYNIISYRRRKSNLGNTETQDVEYSGSAWVPTENNTSEDNIVKTGVFTQNYSGKTISWTVTQKGKPHESVTTGPYYDNFSDTSLNFPYTGGSKTVTCTKYYLVDGVRSNETTESKTISCSENSSTSSKSWTETFNGQTISCTQDGKPESPILGPYYRNVHPTSVTISQSGGYATIYYTEYYTQDSEEVSSSEETTRVGTQTANDSYTEKVWQENVHGTIVTVTQLAKEETHDYEFYFDDGSKSTSVTERMDATGSVISGSYSIVSTDNGNSCSYSIESDTGDYTGSENYSENTLTRVVVYKQSGSGNTITLTVVQDANERVYSVHTTPSRINNVPFNNGVISTQIEGWWTWKYGSDTKQYDRDVQTKTADVGTNDSTESTRSGTESFDITINGKVLTATVDWIQDKAPSATVVSDYIKYDQQLEFPAKGGTHSVSVTHMQKMSDGSEVTVKSGTVSITTTDNFDTTFVDGARQMTFDGIEFTLNYSQKACDYREITLSVSQPQVQGDTITVIGELSEACPFSVSAGASGNFVNANGTSDSWSANLNFSSGSSSTTGEYTDSKGDVSSVEMTGSSIYTSSRWYGDSIYYKL